MRRKPLMSYLVLFTALVSIVFLSGCSVEASKNPGEIATTAAKIPVETVSKGATIQIKPNSPADTVRVFYKHLREKKFREALFLTNLRPAIEGLTDAELKEFNVDFERIAKHVPAVIEINGEIISGDSASVTAKLPDEDLEKSETQSISLRNEKGVWIILTVDGNAEKLIKKEGKNYFHSLRMETHQDEARDMLDRLVKAQIAFAAQNQGLYGDKPALIAAELLPDDIRTSESTGYNYSLTLSNDKKTYTAAATPAVYGKTGKLSFAVNFDAKNNPRLTSSDNGGRPLAK